MGKGEGERRAKRGRRTWCSRCSQDIADSSAKSQALTETGFEMSSFGFTAIDSAADNMQSASLVFAISMVPMICPRSPSTQFLRMGWDDDGRVTAMDHHAAAGWPTATLLPAFMGKGVNGAPY